MVIRIRRPRGLTNAQLIVAMVVGVAAGSYIWQPLFLKYKKEQSVENKNNVNLKPPEAQGICMSNLILFLLTQIFIFAGEPVEQIPIMSKTT